MSIEIHKQINPIERQITETIQSSVAQFEEVQSEVKSRLRYEHSRPWDEYDSRPVANCIGFTVLGSELLQERGLRHNIGFVNGHATIISLIDDGEKHEQWLFDMLSPQLNQQVDKAVHPLAFNDDDRDFAFLFPHYLNTRHLDQGVHPADEHPWLSLEKPNFHSPDIGYANGLSQRLILTLFRPEQGREILTHYQEYRQGVDTEQNLQAAQAVISLSGRFPDIDIRTDHPPEIKRLVKDLSYEDNIEGALEVTNAFFDSFSPSSDTRVDEYRADCLRAISKISGKSEFAKRATEIYESILSRPKASTQSVAGKLAVSKALL